MAEQVAGQSLSERIAALQAQQQEIQAATTTTTVDDQAADFAAVDRIDLVKFNSQYLLGFGLVFLLCITFVLARQSEIRVGSILKLYGTILIVFMSVYLVVAGWDLDQITPVIGLLGTIAGYLLGAPSTNDGIIRKGSATPTAGDSNQDQNPQQPPTGVVG